MAAVEELEVERLGRRTRRPGARRGGRSRRDRGGTRRCGPASIQTARSPAAPRPCGRGEPHRVPGEPALQRPRARARRSRAGTAARPCRPGAARTPPQPRRRSGAADRCGSRARPAGAEVGPERARTSRRRGCAAPARPARTRRRASPRRARRRRALAKPPKRSGRSIDQTAAPNPPEDFPASPRCAGAASVGKRASTKPTTSSQR